MRKAIGASAKGATSAVSDEDEAIDFNKVQLFLPREHEEEPKETPKTQTKAEPLTESAPKLRAEESAEAFEIPVAPPKQVLCVESQSKIQEVFRKSLSKMGYRVSLVGDAGRAAERYRETIPDVVIFDTDGLGSEAVGAFLDMHDKARKDGHPLASLVLLGPRQLAIREQLPADDRVIVLAKPVKMKQIQEAIAQLVPVG